MQEELLKIKNWASHGSLRQFYTEMAAKMRSQGYDVALEGNGVTFYRTKQTGGILGLLRRHEKTIVLRVIWQDDQIVIPEESIDAEFVGILSKGFAQH